MLVLSSNAESGSDTGIAKKGTKKLLGAPGIATRSKNATRNKKPNSDVSSNQTPRSSEGQRIVCV